MIAHKQSSRFVEIWLGQNFTPPDDEADLTQFFRIKFCMSRIEVAKFKIRDAMAGMSEDANDDEMKRVADIINGIIEQSESIRSVERVRSVAKNKEEYSSIAKQLREAMLAFDETKAHKLISVMEGDFTECFEFSDNFDDLSDLENN